MKINENIAISTPRALLVPYEHGHVLKYHGWMQDPAIQEATASEPLTLEEEYANQQSWRTSHDKLTFIVCQPLPTPSTPDSAHHVDGGEVDSPDRMVGDINFFIYPADSDDDDSGAVKDATYEGEVDIMIADSAHRSKGYGRAAVTTLLYYVARHSQAIMGEYLKGCQPPAAVGGKLSSVMARIKAQNVGSIALFRSLGFEQRGEINYFGEIKMVLPDERFMELADRMPEGYAEVEYRRPVQ